MNRCVLVTGGSGFIGTWVLRELLNCDARVVVIDSQKSPDRWKRVLGDRSTDVAWSDASLLNCDELQNVIAQHQVTHLIHLAALLTPACQQDPWLGCQVNVMGSTAVFEAARLSGRITSVAYASSYAVYGPESGAEGSEPNRPPSFYGAFKQAVDLIAEQYWRHFGISSVAIRPHVVYGPEREIGLTAGPSLACRAVARGETYSIGYTGCVGYDYVEDVARAFVRAAFECPPGATVADLPGEQATTEQFLRAIETVAPESAGKIQVSGPSIPANIPPHPKYINELFSDWKATSLLDGVRQTIEYYRNKQANQML
ncbi:MAG: NAD-dependent epimerase/dehydratase family protein [Fuerstia sp.]|nr:NAD-dependent epimerase/dehydratase family protein [Fuerstiella sp.]